MVELKESKRVYKGKKIFGIILRLKCSVCRTQDNGKKVTLISFLVASLTLKNNKFTLKNNKFTLKKQQIYFKKTTQQCDVYACNKEFTINHNNY